MKDQSCLWLTATHAACAESSIPAGSVDLSATAASCLGLLEDSPSFLTLGQVRQAHCTCHSIS